MSTELSTLSKPLTTIDALLEASNANAASNSVLSIESVQIPESDRATITAIHETKAASAPMFSTSIEDVKLKPISEITNADEVKTDDKLLISRSNSGSYSSLNAAIGEIQALFNKYYYTQAQINTKIADLTTMMKSYDATCVHITGNESIKGNKTFNAENEGSVTLTGTTTSKLSFNTSNGTQQKSEIDFNASDNTKSQIIATYTGAAEKLTTIATGYSHTATIEQESNGTKSQITLSADKINLSGDVNVCGELTIKGVEVLTKNDIQNITILNTPLAVEEWHFQTSEGEVIKNVLVQKNTES